ncbi:hypothetical protein CMV_005272 [Castanea mollissima]|uniref:Uncharacterized protein n=1 Tax=Castanea mollissima TaxID=60419 RepID=A0A8J4RT11_9ROSI|nr:hypothetical protein CMV_005272 [Castanea mollissima]
MLGLGQIKAWHSPSQVKAWIVCVHRMSSFLFLLLYLFWIKALEVHLDNFDLRFPNLRTTVAWLVRFNI